MLAKKVLYTCFQKNVYSIFIKSFSSLESNFIIRECIKPIYLLNKQTPNLYVQKKLKHKKNKFEQVNEPNEVDTDVDNLSSQVESYEKLHNRTVPSLRLDTVLKSCLGIGRNKIDTDFYESKIRLNGNKVTKKSIDVNDEDEIDVFVDVSPDNQNFIIVSRVKIIKTSILQNGFKVSFVRDKSLLVEDYR
ncbi:mitochondrial transcription rescue factor 1 [Leptopilina heterotoma]|uniref:mitochondrial transcription rescue factor 1 n=1 Tax=Leptopilina heterotoma TaxID=63436 RepID=UPI001CA81035|nr:mitochondrial transcription rescue factor 1 [Leptopilina heterotoma]